MLEQIKLFELQIIQVEAGIHDIVMTQDNYLTTIIGVRDIRATVIMVEIGDINRLEVPNQLVPNPEILLELKISYQNVVLRRRAICQVAFIAAFHALNSLFIIQS